MKEGDKRGEIRGNTKKARECVCGGREREREGNKGKTANLVARLPSAHRSLVGCTVRAALRSAG